MSLFYLTCFSSFKGMTTVPTLTNTEFASLPYEVPRSLRTTTVKQGLPARRTIVKIRAEQQSYQSNKNNLVRIMLPNDALYDTRGGYLKFDLEILTTGGTRKRLHNGSFSVFQRMRVMAGATEIEDINDWNEIYSILYEIGNPALVRNNVGTELLGFGTQLQRDTWAAAGVKTYGCTLFSGVFNTELLPFECINSGIVLELYLAQGVNVVETDGTNPIIIVSNVTFYMHRIDVDPTYYANIKSMVKARGLQIGFRTWEKNVQALTTGARSDLTINQKSSSLNTILNVFMYSAQLSDTLVNDKFLTWTPSPGGVELISTQNQINGKMYPDEPIDCSSLAQRIEPYIGYTTWDMKWRLNGLIQIAPAVSHTAFNNNRFIQIDDYEAYPEEPDLVNPFTTLGNNATLIKKIQFAGAIPSSWQLNSWAESFRQVIIRSDGRVAVLN